jgi:acyl-CoA thioesterase I
MEHVVHFFGTGIAFFVGIGAVLLALAIFSFFKSERRKPYGSMLAAVGLVLVALSATPLLYEVYAVGAMLGVAWLIAERIGSLRQRIWLRGFALCLCLIAVGFEIPYWLPTQVPAMDRPTLYVIGDSVSGGISDSEADRLWPKVLGESRDVPVVNLAIGGATAATALQQAEKLPETGGLVLLEIGGNDMLGTTTSERFESDLDALITRVVAADRVTLMFELPLPPFRNEFGRIQRRLAAKHGVRLIPKHVFCEVLTADGMTIDGIHLTRAGHVRMAEVVWGIVHAAYGK